MMLALYVVIVAVALLAAVLGGATGYFFFRARQREHAEMLERMAQDLAEREVALRERPAETTSTAEGDGGEATRMLRVEVEQKKQEIHMLREDFDVEMRVLTDEIRELKQKLASTAQDRRRLQRQEEELVRKREAVQRQQATVQSDREGVLRARADLEREREELEQVREHLRKREAQLDDRLLAIPLDAFTSRQEGLLIRRLRQEIKKQRDELEALYMTRRRAS